MNVPIPSSRVAVDIHPRGVFHVGDLGVGREETLDYVPSDTLYAALVVAWVAMADAGPHDPPPFQITSAFPRVGRIRLYPRPLVRINADQDQRDQLGKKLLKFKWCSERIFRLLLSGADVTEFATGDNFSAGFWLHPEDKEHLPHKRPQQETFWAMDIAPHVTLDRLTNAPNLFHTGRVTFGPGCGLWFGVRLATPDARERLELGLRYLADAGLGGMRSTGHGGFEYSVDAEWHCPTQPASGYAVTLARYLPADAEELESTLRAKRAAYSLVRVGGWCQADTGHPWRRRQVRLVREGSVIGHRQNPDNAAQADAVGQIANVVPDNVPGFGARPVLRYGLAFPVAAAEEALL